MTLLRPAALLALILILAFGCKQKDSEDYNTLPTSLVGSWELRRSTALYTDISTTPPTVRYSLDTSFAAGTNTYFTFYNDGSYVVRNFAKDPIVRDGGVYQLASDNTKLLTNTSATAGAPDTIGFAFASGGFILIIDEISSNIRTQQNFTFKKP
jgi:hypothetical protein